MRLDSRLERWLPVAMPVLISAVLLVVRIAADPPAGLTASHSPFTDEGWDALNARNLVVLGTWAPDDWALHPVNLPFSLLSALSFELFGPGLVQARLISVLATLLTVGLLSWWTRDRWGPVAALVAGLAYGCATLVLGHGGTALLEPLVTVLLVGAFVALTDHRSDRSSLFAGVLLAAAVATKLLAVLMLAGILGGALFDRASLRRVALVVAASAACGIGFALALVLTDPTAIDAARRIWAPISWPASLADAWQALLLWPSHSDSVVPLAWPLLVAGALGVAVTWRGRMAVARRREVFVLLGWFVVPFVLLVFASYQPNRYVLPALPPLAILAGIGAARALAVVSQVRWRAAVAIGLVALVSTPGLATWAGWVASGSTEIARAQAVVAALVPAGATIEGDLAPTLGMSSDARLITSRPADGINAGDLYEIAGVRWFVGRADEAPAWASLHRRAWTSREARHCLPLDGQTVCVYELP